MTTLAKAKTRAKKTLIIHASLMIVIYNRQNIFIVQTTGSHNGRPRLAVFLMLLFASKILLTLINAHKIFFSHFNLSFLINSFATLVNAKIK